MYVFETPAFSFYKDEAMDLRSSTKKNGSSMTKIILDSPEASTITELIRRTNFDEEFTCRYWRIDQLELVKNDRLQKNYDIFKDELKTLGRKFEDLDDVLVFTAETDKSCREISVEGRKVCLRKRHVLGYTGSGVHLVRNFDILSRYMAYQQYSSPAYIMVYKAFLGKTKPIVPRLHKDDNYVSPWCGFDCHVSARKIEADMPICEALNCSYVYFYEYDDISSNTVAFPRQILPYAVLRLIRRHTLGMESPFYAVGRNHLCSPVEVKGETRRGFRFTYPQNYRKMKPKKQNIEKHILIKNSLKEQLLEMRTKGDTRSFPPPLEKSQTDSNEKVKNGNDRLKILSPPTLLKFDSVTINFKGEKFCVSPTVRNKKIKLHSGKNEQHVTIKNEIVDKGQKFPDNSKVRRLPLSMKPFVSVKRLQRNSLHRIRNRQESKQIQTTELKNKQKVPEYDINDLDVNQNTEFQHHVIKKYEQSSSIKQINSIQNLKQKKVCSEASAEDTCNSSRKDDRIGTNNFAHGSLNVFKERCKTSHNSSQECDIRRGNKDNTFLRIPSTAKDIQPNGVSLSLNVLCPNESNVCSFDELENFHKKDERNTYSCSLTKIDQVATCNEVKADIIKPRSRPLENEKSENPFHTANDKHTSPMKIMPSADKNRPEKKLDIENRNDILTSNKEYCVSTLRTNKGKLNIKEQSQHLKDKQRHRKTGVQSNHTEIELLEEIDRRSGAINSDISKKLVHSLETMEHIDQNEKNVSEKTNRCHAVVAISESNPYLSEISLTKSIPISRDLEINRISSNHFSSSKIVIKGRDKELTAQQKSIDQETSKNMHGKMEKFKPKTIKDLFQEPLRKELFEKMKSNPRLMGLSMPFDIQIRSHSGLEKTASPPAGLVAPVQLDYSPTVASAKVSSSPITANYISKSMERNICQNNQRKWNIDKRNRAELMNWYSYSQTGYGNVKYSPSMQNEKHHRTDQIFFRPKIQDCQYQAMDKEQCKKSLPLEEIQKQNRTLIKGGSRLANVCTSTSISQTYQQSLPFPVIQEAMGIRTPPTFNIPNLIYEEPTKSEDKTFPTRENVLSCYKQTTKLSPRDPRIKINELQENEIETPSPNKAGCKQLKDKTPPSELKKPDESTKLPSCTQAVSPQKDNKKGTYKPSADKSGLVIDLQTAEKLQRVLRQHICEVKKNSNPKTPDECVTSEQVTKREIITSSEEKILQGTHEMSNKDVNVNVEANYNLNLLASKTVEESESKNSNIDNGTGQGDEDPEKNIENSSLPSPMESQTDITEQFDYDSQDTVIGGLELSPPRIDYMIENLNVTFTESLRKSCIRNNTHESSKCDLSRMATENNDGSLALKSLHCDSALSDNSIVASIQNYSSLDRAEICLVNDKRDSNNDKSDDKTYCSSVDKEDIQVKESWLRAQSDIMYKTINEHSDRGEIVHQNLLERQKIENDFYEMKHTFSNKDVLNEIPFNIENRGGDSINVEDTDRKRESVEEEIEQMTTKHKLNHKDTASDIAHDKKELERKKEDPFEEKDVQIQNGGNDPETEREIENIMIETRSSNIENTYEHEAVSDDEEDEGPPDLTKGCCSDFFGSFHHLNDNDFACGQSPRAYRSAIIDTLQELSSVLKSLNEPSLNRGSANNDQQSNSSVDMIKLMHEGKETLNINPDAFADETMEEEAQTEDENKKPSCIVSTNIKILEVKSVKHNENLERSQDCIPLNDVKTEQGENADCKTPEVISGEANSNEIKSKPSISNLISSLKLKKEEPSCFTKESALNLTIENNNEQAMTNKEIGNDKDIQLDQHIPHEENKENKEKLTLDERITGSVPNEPSNTIEIMDIQKPSLLDPITHIGAIQKFIQTSVNRNQVLDSSSHTPKNNEMSDPREYEYETKLEQISTSNPLKENEAKEENFATKVISLTERNVTESDFINGIGPESECNGLRKESATEHLPTPMILTRNEKEMGSFIQPDNANKDAPVTSETTQTSGLNQSSENSMVEQQPLSSPLKTDNLSLDEDTSIYNVKGENENNILSEKKQILDMKISSELHMKDQYTKTTQVMEICKSSDKLENLLEGCLDGISTQNMSEAKVDSIDAVMTENCRSIPISENEHTQESLYVVEDMNIHNNDTDVQSAWEQASEYNIISNTPTAENSTFSNLSQPSYLNKENIVIKQISISYSEKADHTKDTTNENQISDLQSDFMATNINLFRTNISEEKVKENGDQFKNSKSDLDINAVSESITPLSNMKQGFSTPDVIEQENIKINQAIDITQISTVEQTGKPFSSDQSEVDSRNIEMLADDSNKMACLEKVLNAESRKKVFKHDKFHEIIDIEHVKNAQSTQRLTFETGSYREKEPDSIDSCRDFTQNPLLVFDQTKRNQSTDLSKTKTILWTNTNGIKGKSGILNRRMKERKNMFDTRLNIQRMRAKLTSPLITNVTVEVNETTSPSKNTDLCFPKDYDAQTMESSSVSLKTVLRDEPKTATSDSLNRSQTSSNVIVEVNETSDFLNRSETSSTKQHPSDSSQESQSTELASSFRKMGCNQEVQNARQEEKIDDLKVSRTNENEQDTERSTEKIKKRNIIPFQTVMKKKKEQHLKYKHGLARNKFINYSEFRAELREKNELKNDEYLRSFDKKIWNPCYKKFNYHINKQRRQENLIASQLHVHSQSNQKPIVSERGTKLYEDTYESDICEDRNENNRSHVEFIGDDTHYESQESHEPLNFDYERKERHTINRNASYRPDAPHTFRRSQTLKKRPFVLQHKTGPFYSARSFRPFGFNHGKNGYFSWRRKYKNGTRSFGNERVYVTRKGVVQTEEEQREWKMFKERERIRVQIEEAVKDYRRTFENSSDDVVGDAKVSKYLQSLTDKLDHIQNKRKLLHIPEQWTTPCLNARDNYDEVTPSTKQSSEQVEVKRLVSVDNIRDQFENSLQTSVQSDKDASLVDTLWREHEGKPNQSRVLENMFKEHFLKHLDTVTEKLKFELFARLAREHLDLDKTEKRPIGETNKGEEIFSKIVEKQLDSIRYSKKQSNGEGYRNVQSKFTTGRALDKNDISDDFDESDRFMSRDKNTSKSTVSYFGNSSAENRSYHSKSREGVRRVDSPNSQYRKRSNSGRHERSRSRSNSPWRSAANKYNFHRKKGQIIDCFKRSRSRTRSRSRDGTRLGTRSPEYQSSEYNKKRKRSKSTSHSSTRSRSHSLEKYTRKKKCRGFDNDEDQCVRNCPRSLNEGPSKGDSSHEPEEFNNLSKDLFDRYIKSAVESKWDNTTDDEAPSDMRRIKQSLTFRDQNDSNRKSDKRLNAQKEKNLFRRQELTKIPFRHESTTNCDGSDEESNYDDGKRESAKWNMFDKKNNGLEYKKSLKYRERYNWGHNMSKKSFTMGYSNHGGGFPRYMKYSRGSSYYFDKRYNQESRYYREGDRFPKSYEDERTDRVNKWQTCERGENYLDYAIPEEFDNQCRRDWAHHYQNRYEDKQNRRGNVKNQYKRPFEEDREIYVKQVYDSGKEKMVIDGLSSSSLNSFQRSYSHKSDSGRR